MTAAHTPFEGHSFRSGFLNLAKPPGVTSRAVVNTVQRLVRPHKAGHAGTLDPLASGVLVVGVGAATRLISYVQRQPKEYEASFLLGVRSDTDDVEGNVTEVAHATYPTREQIEAALPHFMGEISQRPPAYSALKVGGKRAYALARKGRPVELAPRLVTIHHLLLGRYEYPRLDLEIYCSSGTYVRALGRDLAERLGTGAVMSALVRSSIGPFKLAEAVAPDTLAAENIGERLLPPEMALVDLPRISLRADEVASVLNGRAVDNRFAIAQREIAALDPSGRLVAILEGDGGSSLRPVRCFPHD